MGSGSPGLLETAAACAEQQLEAFTPPQLAKVGKRHWAAVPAHWMGGEEPATPQPSQGSCTLRITHRAIHQPALPPWYVQVAWSFAKLDWPAPRVLRHAGSQLAAHTAAFSDKEASNVLWALASQVRGDGPQCVGSRAV